MTAITRDLLEKTFLREMIGFTAQRLMDLEVETGASRGSRRADRPDSSL